MTRIPSIDCANWLAAMAYSKRQWLQEHGPSRPEWVRVQTERDAGVLEQAASEYRASHEKRVQMDAEREGALV